MEESSTTSRPQKKAKGGLEESDIFSPIFEHYGNLDAPESHRIIRTATDIRSRIDAKSLPRTPLYYFLGVVDRFHRNKSDEDVDVLSRILAITLPQVSEKVEVKMAVVAVNILTRGVQQLSVMTEMAFKVVECLAQLLLDLCDCDPKDWESVKLGFNKLIELSLEIDPKVRKLAQDCVVKLFQTFKSTGNKTSATKWVSASLRDGWLRITDDDDEDLALRMLELLKFLLPLFPSALIYEEFFSNLYSSLRTSSKTKYLLDVSEALLGFFESESIYFVLRKKYSIADKWKKEYYSVAAGIAVLLNSHEEEATLARASAILLGVVEHVHFISDEQLRKIQDFYGSKESEYLSLLCDSLLEALGRTSSFPNKYLLDVISEYFYEFGPEANLYMRNILVRLVSQTVVDGALDEKHLRACIGYAVIAMHEDKLFEVISIELDTSTHSCLNPPWILSLLKDYVFASSLGFFLDKIVPLAHTVEEASQKETESVKRQQIESFARDLWGLLPAFCRCPGDVLKSFESLASLVIPCIREDSLMLESAAIAMQYLVKRNKDMSFLPADEASKLPQIDLFNESMSHKNFQVMSLHSKDLLEVFSKVFFHVPADKRGVMKETIECLSLITESSAVKGILLSIFKEMKSVAGRSLVLELVPSSVGAASMDFPDILYSCIEEWFKVEDDKSLGDVYDVLHKILNEYPESMSSKFDQLVELLRSPDYVGVCVGSRLLCLKILFLSSIKTTCGRENKDCHRMLEEILENYNLTRSKKLMHVACSVILEIGASLEGSGLYYEFIRMIMSCLSPESVSEVRSGAVNALSRLIYKDPAICKSMPELVPAIIALLDDRTSSSCVQAVLKFITVLATCLDGKWLKRRLSYILGALLPLISSRQYEDAITKSKVKSILGILDGKCGSASVKSCAPLRYLSFVDNALKNRPASSSTIKLFEGEDEER